MKHITQYTFGSKKTKKEINSKYTNGIFQFILNVV